MKNQQYGKIIACIAVMAVIFLEPKGVGASPVQLTLEQSIEKALQLNPVVDQGQAQVDSAKAKLDQSRANFGPQITFTASADRTSSVVGYPPLTPQWRAEYPYYENKFQLSLPLYSGEKLENQFKQQRANVTGAEKTFSNTKEQLVLDTTLAYINVLEAQKKLALSQESYDNAEKHLHNVKERFAAGVTIITDVLRSEVELADIRQDLIKNRNALKVGMLTMNSMMKQPLTTELELQDISSGDTPAMPIFSLDDSVKTALAIHPKLASSKAGIAAARYGIRAAESGALPTVNLFGYYDWAESDHFPPRGDNWKVGLSMNFTVLDSGLVNAQVRQSKAALKETAAAYQKLEDDVVLELQSAWFNLAEARERITAAKVAVGKAQEDYNLAAERYDVGVGTNIDVLDAQEALVKSRTNYIQSEYDFARGLAKLRKAMGKSL